MKIALTHNLPYTGCIYKMLINKCSNIKLTAVISLLAMMMFVFVSNIHVHGSPVTCGNSNCIYCITLHKTPHISQLNNINRDSGCPACEILHLGLGNSTITPTVQIETTALCESIPKSPQITIKSFLNNEQPSRAPPV